MATDSLTVLVVDADRELAVGEAECASAAGVDVLGFDCASDAFRGALDLVELVLDREVAYGHAERNREHHHRDRGDADDRDEDPPSHGSSRYPTWRNVVIVTELGSSLRRSARMCMSRVLVEPNQCWSQTSSMMRSRVTA